MNEVVDQAIWPKILSAALSRGGEYADLYYEAKDTNLMVCEGSQIDKVLSGTECGIGIRLIKQQKTAYVYTNDFRQENLLQLAKRLAEHGDQSQADTNIPSWQRLVAETGFYYRIWPEHFASAKAEYLLKVDTQVRDEFPLVSQATLSLNDSKRKIITANSYGEITEQTTMHIRAGINIIAEEEGMVQTATEILSGVSGWEILQELNFPRHAFVAAERASTMLSAKPAPLGRMPVILSSEAGGTMIHEACGHGLEADHIQKRSSIYADQWQKPVAAKHITVIDDASLPNEFGSYEFDGEGVAGGRKVLIQDGVLVGLMHDRLSAMQSGVKPTGNGRRESYKHKPMPRMSNTFIMPYGHDDEYSIIKDTKHGLYVRKIGGGQVNPVTGDFVFHIQEAYRIENGMITYPVRGATLTGNGPEVLKQIDRIANDLGFASGICGKGGQAVPVGDAQPTIRIQELIVGGI